MHTSSVDTKKSKWFSSVVPGSSASASLRHLLEVQMLLVPYPVRILNQSVCKGPGKVAQPSRWLMCTSVCEQPGRFHHLLHGVLSVWEAVWPCGEPGTRRTWGWRAGPQLVETQGRVALCRASVSKAAPFWWPLRWQCHDRVKTVEEPCEAWSPKSRRGGGE